MCCTVLYSVHNSWCYCYAIPVQCALYLLLNWTCKLYNFHYHLCHRFVLYTVSTYVYSINALYGVPGYGRSSRQPQPRIRPGILSLGILLLLSRKEKGRYSLCTVQKTVPGILSLGILLLLSKKEKGRFKQDGRHGTWYLHSRVLLSRKERCRHIKTDWIPWNFSLLYQRFSVL